MDETWLEQAYRRFAPLVHARARRIVGGTEADDVVQEVFVRLIRRPPKDERRLLDWIYATSTNVSLDRLRFRLRRDHAWSEEVRQHVAAAQEHAFEAALASRELFRRLVACVERKTQRVAVLVYLEDMDQNDVARLLGVSRRTVGERLRRFEARARTLLYRWNRS
jgi:RNA polymerase sigma factor (sigma-70 family)